MKEHVVLVDESNKKLGLEDKYKVHTGETPLHRGFSLFIFNKLLGSYDLILLPQPAESIATDIPSD